MSSRAHLDLIEAAAALLAAMREGTRSEEQRAIDRLRLALEASRREVQQ